SRAVYALPQPLVDAAEDAEAAPRLPVDDGARRLRVDAAEPVARPRAGVHPVHVSQDSPDSLLPRVLAHHVREGARGEPLSKMVVATQAIERPCERTDIAGREQQRGALVLDDLRDGWEARGDDRTARRHVLEELQRRHVQ